MPPQLAQLIQQVGSLPSLPTVVVQVNDLVSNPKTSALQLARLILDDQGLTARLLRLVNSPFYGFPRRIATVTEAVTILGFRPVRNLLLTASVVDLLGGEETVDFSPSQLWEHAVATAVGSSLLARAIRHEDREELFVAGLLHDVGKLVMSQFLPAEFSQVLALARREDVPLRMAEQRVLGFSHDQVGRLLTERWKLPVRLSEAIGFHHRPDLVQSAKREAAVVHLANILARALGLGSGGDDAVPPLAPEAWERLGLSADALEAIMTDLEEQFLEAQETLLRSREQRRGVATHVS